MEAARSGRLASEAAAVQPSKTSESNRVANRGFMPRCLPCLRRHRKRGEAREWLSLFWHEAVVAFQSRESWNDRNFVERPKGWKLSVNSQ